MNLDFLISNYHIEKKKYFIHQLKYLKNVFKIKINEIFK
jgi:hypothetical protein